MRIPSTISTTTVGSTRWWWIRERIAPRLDAARTSTRDWRSGGTALPARRDDAPGARGRAAGLEADQRLARAEGVRRTRHRLDGEAAAVHVRQGVAGEDLQVQVALVGPQRERSPARWIVELDPCTAVII